MALALLVAFYPARLNLLITLFTQLHDLGLEFAIAGHKNSPGAISSLANALSTLGIDLDVQDYKEHSIGVGSHVRAATYIQCTASQSKDVVWGVGLHQDVVQASLIALLSAASSVSPLSPPFMYRY